MKDALAIILTALAAGALAGLEWRRPDRRHRAMRIGATLLAVGALALLGWRPTWRRPVRAVSARGVAALWTPGAAPVRDGGEREQFALPGASAPPGATFLPDAGTLRRRFPGVGTLHVYGDGLEPSELAALGGLRVEFHPALMIPVGPVFAFVRGPRELGLGEELAVQGRVAGLTPGQVVTVSLEAPDGVATDAATASADAHGEAAFAVTGAPPPAAGRFVWRLRVGKTDEALGVAVVAPELPRVLALAGAPRFDTAALRHWFETAGGTFDARTTTGQDKYRFESAHDPPPQFTALDARLLAGYDLVLADGRALAALPTPERDALRDAVTNTGLGLLVLADDAKVADPALFPWKLMPSGNDAGEGDRLARVRWPGQARVIEIPVLTAPLDFTPQDGQTPLMRDGQDHVLAASASRGRGLVALTLVRETGRWTRANDPAAFAAYWSELFSALARKTSAADAGHWTLAGGDGGPVFVDQPVDLVWSGPARQETAGGIVTAETGPDGGVALALARDPAEPGRGRGTFWPRREGWHRVMGPGAGGSRVGLDFFVAPAGSWPALGAARRRAATARFAEGSAVETAVAAGAGLDTIRVPVPLAGWWALFLLGASYLWIERRMSAAR